MREGPEGGDLEGGAAPSPSESGSGDAPDLEAVLEGVDEGEAPGWFPSWGWLYATVIVYTAALTLLLWVFSVTLDHGAP